MRIVLKSLLALFAVAVVISPLSLFATEPTPSVEEQMTGLQQMCTDTAEARAQRQTEKSLYERLGKYERIHELTAEIVRLHKANEAIQHMFTRSDSKVLAKHVADFVAAGTGGTATYAGRDLPALHEGMKLTDGDFLSAGGDIVTAMQSKGYGQNEIDEMVCILVSLKDQVVFK